MTTAQIFLKKITPKTTPTAPSTSAATVPSCPRAFAVEQIASDTANKNHMLPVYLSITIIKICINHNSEFSEIF